jgi:hypothetical protein
LTTHELLANLVKKEVRGVDATKAAIFSLLMKQFFEFINIGSTGNEYRKSLFVALDETGEFVVGHCVVSWGVQVQMKVTSGKSGIAMPIPNASSRERRTSSGLRLSESP